MVVYKKIQTGINNNSFYKIPDCNQNEQSCPDACDPSSQSCSDTFEFASALAGGITISHAFNNILGHWIRILKVDPREKSVRAALQLRLAGVRGWEQAHELFKVIIDIYEKQGDQIKVLQAQRDGAYIMLGAAETMEEIACDLYKEINENDSVRLKESIEEYVKEMFRCAKMLYGKSAKINQSMRHKSGAVSGFKFLDAEENLARTRMMIRAIDKLLSEKNIGNALKEYERFKRVDLSKRLAVIRLRAAEINIIQGKKKEAFAGRAGDRKIREQYYNSATILFYDAAHDFKRAADYYDRAKKQELSSKCFLKAGDAQFRTAMMIMNEMHQPVRAKTDFHDAAGNYRDAAEVMMEADRWQSNSGYLERVWRSYLKMAKAQAYAMHPYINIKASLKNAKKVVEMITDDKKRSRALSVLKRVERKYADLKVEAKIVQRQIENSRRGRGLSRMAIKRTAASMARHWNSLSLGERLSMMESSEIGSLPEIYLKERESLLARGRLAEGLERRMARQERDREVEKRERRTENERKTEKGFRNRKPVK